MRCYFRAKHLFIFSIIAGAFFALFIYSSNHSLQSKMEPIEVVLHVASTSELTTDSLNRNSFPKTSSEPFLEERSPMVVIDPTKAVIARYWYEPGHLNSPDICPDHGQSLKLLIVVVSAAINVEARLAM